MARSKQVKVTDIDGNEKSVSLSKGATLGDFLGSGQVGLVNGESMSGDTTLRAGDHVEVLTKSGKAG